MKIHSRFQAAAFHFAISLMIVLLMGVVVFWLWFPHPFRVVSGGQNLFWLVVVVDIVCGPVLTFIVLNSSKSRCEIFLDFFIIGLVQLSALGYGVYSLSQARPVALVFEDDRFVAVPSAHINASQLKNSPSQFKTLSWTGPVLLGTHSAKGLSSDESLAMYLEGRATSSEPSWWQSYEESKPDVRINMKPLGVFLKRLSSSQQTMIKKEVETTGKSISSLYYLPLTGQNWKESWCVLLDAEANIVGYVEADGF